MIDLYSWMVPNGQKIHIMLEETGLPYRVNWVDIFKGEQFRPEYLAISPNNKVPALIDDEGPGGRRITLFESGAILIYLAEKTGRFFPEEPFARFEVLQWLFWQVGGFGPMLGQAHHFNAYAPERIPYAMARYTNEARRLYRVLDTRLNGREFVAGDYSIADMAIFPWCRLHHRQNQRLEDFPNVKRWFEAIAARPAVARDLARLEDKSGEVGGKTGVFDKEAWESLFGRRQYRQR
jgi:GST-like protein